MGNVLSKFKRIAKRKKGRDVFLEVADDKENVLSVSADEKLLSSHNAVFRRMSKTGVLRKRKVIPLNNITFVGLQKIMRFIETDDVTFENYKQALETLKAAFEYEIDIVKKVSVDYLITKLDPSNVCEIYEFSETHDLYELIYECLQVIDRNINEVLANSGLTKLQLPRLVSVTKRGNLNLRSEFCLLRAIIEWGKQEMIKRDINPYYTLVLIDIISPALGNLRCETMSNRKHNAPEFGEAYKYLLAKGSLRRGAQTLQRSYTENFKHELRILKCPQTALSEGDCFNLTTQVIKGRVLFLGVSLALETVSSNSRSAACLYVVLSATNNNTSEKKVIRHTFFNVNNDTSLKFKSPLVVKENELFTIKLKVKMTGKISPLSRENETDIFFSPERDVVMKIFPEKSSHKKVKCIFREILYYF